MIPAKASLEYLFGNHKSERLTLVAWGNIQGRHLDYYPHPADLHRKCTPETERHTEGNHLPVTDMFYCRKELNNTPQEAYRKKKASHW